MHALPRPPQSAPGRLGAQLQGKSCSLFQAPEARLQTPRAPSAAPAAAPSRPPSWPRSPRSFSPGSRFTSTSTGNVATPRSRASRLLLRPCGPDSSSPPLPLARRARPKVQYNGYAGHESSNGQASFENPMYDTNLKPTEAKAVRFDTTLNTVCTVV